MKRTKENVAPIDNNKDTYSRYDIRSKNKRTKRSTPLSYAEDEQKYNTETTAYFNSTASTEDSEDQQDDTQSTTSSKVSSFTNNPMYTNSNNNNKINGNNDKNDSDKEKLIAGSEEWVKLRRLTHNEVERRRRININERLNELADLIGTKEKRKGFVLRDAIAFIRGINDKFNQEQEKWTLDKIVAEETIKQIQNQIDDLKSRYMKNRMLNRELCSKLGEDYIESDDDGEEDNEINTNLKS